MASPTVALNTPADTATGVSLTPALVFTGTDAESDDIRYEVEVDTANTFDSQVGGSGVLGDQNTEVTANNWGANEDHCVFTFSGTTGTYTGSISVYLDTVAGGGSNKMVVGIYNENGSHTGSLLSSSSEKTGLTTGWQTAILTNSFTLTNGQNYWLAVHAPSGNYGRIASGGGAAGQHGYHTRAYDGTLATPMVDDAETNDLCSIYLSYSKNTPLIDAVSGTDAGFSGTARISGSNLTSGGFNGDGAYVTASITPTANRLLLATVTIENGASTNPTDPTITGNSLTWVKVDSVLYDSASSSRRKLFVYRALSASPTTGAVTITCGEAEIGAVWAIDQFTGIDTSGTNGSGAIVQSATNSDESGAVNTLTATLSAFGNSNNATFGADGNATGSLTVTPGSGFTKLAGTGQTSPGINVATEWKNSNDTSVDFSISANDYLGVIGIEIKAGTDIFSSGTAVTYTVQSALANSTLYYWRVRGKDPSGSNTYGAWATTQSFTTISGFISPWAGLGH